MHQTDSTKRIPKSLGTDAKLFGRYTLTDLAVALLPGVAVVLLMQVIVPSSLTIAGYRPQLMTLPLAAVAIAIGGIFVYVTPSYTSSLDWIGTFAAFYRDEQELPHEEAKAHTQIERIHPEDGVIERTDGAYVGLIQVEPPTMALATDEEWAETCEAFRDFCNTTVRFPIQLFSTTQPFPVDEYLAHYEDRLDDSDVEANPRLAALIEHYVEWYREDLAQRRMTIRDHYVVVTVSPREVQFDSESLGQQLTDVPLLGVFVEARYAPKEAEQRAAMVEELDDRLGRIESGIREIEGCTTRRVSVEEATTVIREYWAGESCEEGRTARKLRTTPLVGGPA